MTAIVAVDLRPFNEIYVIADTRVSYISNGRTFIDSEGVQKIIPIIGADRRSVGAIGFSGYLAPVQIIIHHLLVNKRITNYRAPFVIEQVVENLRGFIQEGYNNVPDKYKKLPFVMMFVAIDTERRSVFKDASGNIIADRLKHPIYLSRMYLFTANKRYRIEATVSEETVTVIGSGKVAAFTLDSRLDDMVSVGRPYDDMAFFRSWLIGDTVSEIFQAEKIHTIGSPYWIWEIFDQDRRSRQSWQWGYNPSQGNPNINVEQRGHDFIITNKLTGEKRTVRHILNWTNGLRGALV